MKTKIEKVEFFLSDAVNIVFIKAPSGWDVIKYKHGEMGKTTHTLSNIPTIKNAHYFNERL